MGKLCRNHYKMAGKIPLMIPITIVDASVLGFSESTSFEITNAAEREAPKVSLS